MNTINTVSQAEKMTLIRQAFNNDIKVDLLNIRCTEIESYLESFDQLYGLELRPDFQRGLVWIQEQRVQYIETLVSGAMGMHGRLITFNCASYNNTPEYDTDIPGMICLDGMQRLAAIRDFIARKFKVYPALDLEHGEGVDWDYFNDTRYSMERVGNGLVFQILNMVHKKEVLRYYLMLNSGGTAHSPEEIQRITDMLQNK